MYVSLSLSLFLSLSLSLSLFMDPAFFCRFAVHSGSSAEKYENTQEKTQKERKEVNFTKIFRYFKLLRALFVFLVGATSFSAP